MTIEKTLSPQQSKELFEVLKLRFDKNLARHEGISWNDLQTRLENNLEKLWSINEMEKTGGEPDVISYDAKTNEYIICDCSKESPINRRNLCYDRKALESRKANKPENSVIDMADEMGVELLSEEQYRELQNLGEFDVKTSSWVKTPKVIRELGGALFCDRRYNHVFVYHNGAESYYSARGFRGLVKI